MKCKDQSVQCKFHPVLTEFLMEEADFYFRTINSEATITSGSEPEAKHGVTSLHYSDPCCAADLRSWTIIYQDISYTAQMQHEELLGRAASFCIERGMPTSWLEVILEGDHHHIEYQPKRQF